MVAEIVIENKVWILRLFSTVNWLWVLLIRLVETFTSCWRVLIQDHCWRCLFSKHEISWHFFGSGEWVELKNILSGELFCKIFSEEVWHCNFFCAEGAFSENIGDLKKLNGKLRFVTIFAFSKIFRYISRKLSRK